MADSANVGYASLQVIPTVRNISGDLAGQLGIPLQRAGQQAGQRAGQAIASGIEASAARVRTASDKVANAQETQRSATAKLAIEEAKLQELRERGITGGSRYMAQSERVRAAQVRESQARQGVTRATETLTTAEREAAEATEGLGDSVDDTGRKSLISKDNLVKFGLAAGAAVAGLGKVLYDIGGRFDDVSDTIRVSTGATGQSLAGMEDVVKRVGTSVPSSFEDIAVTVSDLNKRLGLTGPDLEQVAAQISELGNMGQEIDMDSLTASMNAFGIKGAGVSRTLDQLFQASQRTGVPITNLTQSVLKGGPALRQFGFDMGQSAGLIGTLSKSGLDADKMMMGLTKSLGVFAKEGQKPQEALKKNVVAIGDFIKAGDSAGALNLANKLFGTRGGAQFVEAIQTGKLSVEDFVRAAGGGGDTIRGAAEDTRDFAEQWEMFKNKALVAIEPVATRVFGILGSGMEWINTTGVPALMSMAQWVDRNKVTLGIIAGVITTLLLPALITYGVTSTATWAKSALDATKAAATSLAASYKTVGGWIMMSASAVANAATSTAAWIGAGLRSAGAWIAMRVSAMASFIATATGAVVQGAITAGAWVASGARSAGAYTAMKVATIASFVATSASAVVQAGITAGAWVAGQARVALSVGMATAAFVAQRVATVAGTVATGALTVAQWALNAAMRANPIGLIITIIMALVAAIVLAYQNSETFRNIVQAAWQGIQMAASFAWNNILKPALDGFMAALGWVGDKAMWLWQTVMIPAWDAIKNAISAVWNFIRPILDNIGKGIHALGTIASKVGDAMRNAFNGVVDVLKAPIHAVGTVLANIPEKVMGITIPGAGTLRSWGSTLQSLRVGGVVGGKAGRTRDGVLWGPGSGTDDAILGLDARGLPTALVSNKEGVVTADAMDNGGAGLVAALNRGWRPLASELRNLGVPGYAAGGTVGSYGLPSGTDISSGGPGFPAWVNELGKQHGVQPSTYAGHQESDRGEPGYAPNPQRLNRGIDWGGPVDALQKFADYLFSIAPSSPSLEQIIWQNPNTGNKVGWGGGKPDTDGSYYAAVYAGHQNHVHTRQSGPIGGPAKPAIPDTVTRVPDYVPPSDLNPDQANPSLYAAPGAMTPTPAAPGGTSGAIQAAPESKRLKTFKELGSDLGGILAGGVEEFFGDSVPKWVWDPNELKGDSGDDVRTSDTKGTTGQMTAPGAGALTPEQQQQQMMMMASPATPGTVSPDMAAPGTSGFAPDTPETLKAMDESTKNKTPQGPGGMPNIQYNPGGGAEQWRPLAQWAIDYVNKSLKGPAQLTAMLGQIQDESGGDPKAQNNWDINAQNGVPSGGLLQVIEPTFQANRDPRLPNDKFHPGANLVAALRYYVPKYGQDLTTRWGRGKGGYRAGGYTGNMDPAHIAGVVHGREFVVRSPFAQKNRAILEAMNSGADMGDLLVKSHQSGVGRISAVEQNARRDGGGNKLADVVNIQGYTAEEISSEWNRYQWARTAGYGTSRNR